MNPIIGKASGWMVKGQETLITVLIESSSQVGGTVFFKAGTEFAAHLEVPIGMMLSGEVLSTENKTKHKACLVKLNKII